MVAYDKTHQAKYVTDEQILYVIDMVRNNQNMWTSTWDLDLYYPHIPPKVLLAKCRSMIKRGIITGCPCGCRGDFERKKFKQTTDDFMDVSMDSAIANLKSEYGQFPKVSVTGRKPTEFEPQTIYKKQRLDREDFVDVTDLDVVALVKAEIASEYERIYLQEVLGPALWGHDNFTVVADPKGGWYIKPNDDVVPAKLRGLLTDEQTLMYKSEPFKMKKVDDENL